MTPPRLELATITKRYGELVANDAIEFAVAPGEIHALLGENGAGKSTLVKIVYGVLRPDQGEIRLDGRPVTIADPHAARALGIGMVFQHFSLFEALSVAENVALGLDGCRADRPLARRIVEVSEGYGLPLDPHRLVADLSVGERQRIEIVRCLLQDPRLLIMDEPTSVLTPQEAERLFLTLRQLAGEGRSILYISHKLEEVRALCSRATVLRRGQVVASCDPREESAAGLATMMVGTQLKPPSRRPTGRDAEVVRFAVEGLSMAPAEPHGVPLREIAFAVAKGEVFGIAGVAGNGQQELLAALSGERLAPVPEAIRIEGAAVGREDIAARRRRGLAYAPEERIGHAAIADLSLARNALLSARGYERIVRRGLIRKHRAAGFARRVMERFDVRAGGTGAPARSLSGGNLQKFVVGREVLQGPKVLIVAQPTWGVDAGAATVIHQALLDLAASGSAIVLVSQDLDEILALSDRLACINGGRLSGPLVTANARIEEIGLLMGGLHDLGQRQVPGTAHAA